MGTYKKRVTNYGKEPLYFKDRGFLFHHCCKCGLRHIFYFEANGGKIKIVVTVDPLGSLNKK